MNFAFSEEQDQLRDAVRRFMEAKSPESEVRRLMETTEGYDPAVWTQMAQELGLQSLHIPEAHGGQGFTFVELGIVLEEMGRELLCAPYFSTVCLAANAIMNAGTDAEQADLLPGIATGETIAALAFTEPNGRWDAPGITMEAKGSGDSWTLDGTKMFVIDGHTAGTVVVAARQAGTSGEDGISFFVVDGDAGGLTRTPLATMDQTRKQARLDFDGVAAKPLGEPGKGWSALSKTLDQAAVCLANEMVGGAQKVLDMSVEYAKVRVQFGRPIGSFQAIKHKCADMLLEVESGKSAAYYAAWAAAEDNDELPVVASLAKAYCSDAYFHAAAENIQIHGGIGFTWEHPAHLYFKRAKSSEILLGDATYHRELLAQRIGIQRRYGSRDIGEPEVPAQRDARRPLRLLFATPHFFDASSAGPYGSQTEGRQRRSASVARCITALHETFGGVASVSPTAHDPATVSNEVDFVAVTTRSYDLLDELEAVRPLFRNERVDVDPPELGFATLRVIASHLGDYDYYCYLEDDTIVRDPWFFVKLAWFTEHAGEDALLQPNRYEVRTGLKVYPDGPQPPEALGGIPLPPGPAEITLDWAGTPVRFERPSNPHSACWFATETQLRRMTAWKDYGVPRRDFIGLYESACSLAMMRALRVYKPTAPNADLLEVQHRGSSYLEQWALTEPSAVLAARLREVEAALARAREPRSPLARLRQRVRRSRP